MTPALWHLAQPNDNLSFANKVLSCLHEEQRHLKPDCGGHLCDSCNNIDHVQERRETAENSGLQRECCFRGAISGEEMGTV